MRARICQHIEDIAVGGKNKGLPFWTKLLCLLHFCQGKKSVTCQHPGSQETTWQSEPVHEKLTSNPV